MRTGTEEAVGPAEAVEVGARLQPGKEVDDPLVDVLPRDGRGTGGHALGREEGLEQLDCFAVGLLGPGAEIVKPTS